MTASIYHDGPGTSNSLNGLTDSLRRTQEAAMATQLGFDDLSLRLSDQIGSALDDLIVKGKDAGDVLRDLGRDILQNLTQQAVKPAQDALTSGLAQAGTQAASGLFGTLTSAVSGVSLFAQGGLFQGGAQGMVPRIHAFARGGVVTSPTTFPMRDGIGLMGEAGAEAIMPLSRDSQGRLGVSVDPGQGSGGTSRGAQPVSVTIVTNDADSFRRSQSQTAAQLARALDRGRRNS